VVLTKESVRRLAKELRRLTKQQGVIGMDNASRTGLFGVVLSSAAAFGQRPAVIAGEYKLTYQQLVASAGSLAAGLAELGVERGDRVGLLLPNCPQFIVAYLATTALGAVAVPVHCQLSVAEAGYILNHAQAQTLISISDLDSLVNGLHTRVTGLTNLIISGQSAIEEAIELQQLMSGHVDRPVRSDAARLDDPAVLIYTSGTTGQPKGAVLSHRNLLANARSCRELIGVSSEDTFLAVLPLFHSFGATVCMILPLLAGAEIVLQAAFAPLPALEALEKHQVTIFAGVPAMFAVLAESRISREYDLRSLRVCVSGGAPLPLEVLSGFQERYGALLVEGYGPTEASPVVSVNPPKGVQKPGSVGLPIPRVEVRIVDDAGQDLPTGEVGEIIVAGDNIMQGYWQDATATAEAIRDGWLYTGDLGKLDSDGYLYIVDRKKDMIIVGGTNVYPREVEDIIARMPQVAEVAVVGMPDPMRGERARAAIVAAEGIELSAEQVISHCGQQLAPFKVPRIVEFTGALPKSALGKVLKRKLRKARRLSRTSTEMSHPNATL